MKSFKQFREECGCDKKERKGKKKTKTVEVMPTVKDGPPSGSDASYRPMKKESMNYEGPMYAPWSDVVAGRGFDPITERAKSKSQQRFMGMVRAAQKGEKAASPEIAKVATSMSKSDVKDFAKTKHKGLPEKKVKKESFESGVMKARRYHRVGKLMSFKDFMKIMGDILGEWEK